MMMDENATGFSAHELVFGGILFSQPDHYREAALLKESADPSSRVFVKKLQSNKRSGAVENT
jgi:hypothetical protein